MSSRFQPTGTIKSTLIAGRKIYEVFYWLKLKESGDYDITIHSVYTKLGQSLEKTPELEQVITKAIRRNVKNN